MSFYIRPLKDVKEDYNFLMGYTTGKPKEWWYGMEGITHIFNGAWNDSEIGYNGYAINESDVIDIIYSMMEEDYGEDKAKTVFDNRDENAKDGFFSYIKEHIDEIKETLDEWIDNYKETIGLYSVKSYYDKDLKGLSDSFETTDFEEAKEKAHQYVSDGGYVKMEYSKTGKEHILSYDTYFKDFEGEFPLNVEDFEEEDEIER